MKLVVAIVRPEKLPDVKAELLKEKVHMLTVVDVRGCGDQKGYTQAFRGVIEEVQLHRKVMLLIGVNESYLKKTTDAISRGAQTEKGNVGDGKIFVLPLEDCLRIRTGETGTSAIGGDSKEAKK